MLATGDSSQASRLGGCLDFIVDQVEQFGAGSQIPIGTGRADVAQISGQASDLGIDIGSTAVGIQQRIHCETVAQVMQTRGPDAWPGYQTVGACQPSERCLDVAS